MQERLDKLARISEKTGNPYSQNRFEKTQTIAAVKSEFLEEKEVSLAGRLTTRREHGKSMFCDLRDFSGHIQCYLRKDATENFEQTKELDIGDVLGVSGKLFKTKTGEITVFVSKFTVLAKALRSLPEKWHGLKDIELRFRKRYLDLIANPQSVAIFIKRNQIVKEIRSFLDQKGFIEVETPLLHSIPGGASGRPFKTFHNALGLDIYLRIAPELYLKKLLVGGFDNIYELNRSFRNEGISVRHNPEFTMLEVYSCYKDYAYMMELTENMIKELAKRINESLMLDYQDKTIDFSRKFRIFSLASKLKEDFGVEFDDSPQEFIKKMSSRLKIKENLSRSQIIKLIEDLIEEKYYGQEPVFVTDFYTWMSPLAKAKKDNPHIVERFELFIAGIEVANAYSELNDPVEQKKRLVKQLDTEEELPKKLDEDFLEALEYGMPPAAGLGIGIDRLVMILLNQPSLKEVILFPLLKPKEAEE
ncbi:MAG: lysine--tRNA ligase [Candidatus Omnitrophica bacterium]|nr:lysine--tRNA ligase [Candidatus Omnitrophota bacterium]